MTVHGTRLPLCGLMLAGCLAGCGGDGGGYGATDSGEPATVSVDTFGPPPMSIEALVDGSPSEDDRRRPVPRIEPVVGGPQKGTAEWYLQEIQVLRSSSLPDPKQVGAKGVEKALERRNTEIVDLALQVIVKTHEDDSKADLFNEAVRRLIEARLQLALTGNEQYGRDLYADAKHFHDRDPDSEAAGIAAHALLRYAQTNAFRYGGDDPEWIEEYARQARLFATNYPNDERLCAAALGGAARSCELNGLLDEAVNCHAMLVDRFPGSEHAPMSAGVLRRLKLVGQPMKLAGPTLDGGFTSIDDHANRVVLVVFWNSGAKPFRDQLDDVKQLGTKYAKYGFDVLGICLDEDDRSARTFVDQHEVDWPQLFNAEPGKSGWEHPAAVHYGVRDVPTYVLVDHRGTAKLVASDTEKLEDATRTLLLRLRNDLKSRGNE